MATTIAVRGVFNLTTVETLDATVAPAADGRALTHNKFDVSVSRDGSSTPPVSFISHLTLAAASGTIDLTTLPTTEGVRSASGLKLVLARFRSKSVTAGRDFTIQVGASNGYAIGGNVEKVLAGGTKQIDFYSRLAAVGAGTKTLDWAIASYAAGDDVEVTLIFG